MKKILVGFESRPDYADNPKALYEYLRDNFADVFDLVWILTESGHAPLMEKLGVPYIAPSQPDFVEHFNDIIVVFSTHNAFIYLKKSYQTWITLWHGLGMKKQGYLSEYDRAHTVSPNHEIDYFITAGGLMRVVFAATMGIDVARVLELGQPRADYLFTSPGKESLSALVGRNVADYERILFYLPTFHRAMGREDGQALDGNVIGLEPYDEAQLESYLKASKMLLVVKQHPFEETPGDEWVSESVFRLSENSLSQSGFCLNEIMNAADLLLTDYSSVHADFLLLNRPVLFVQADKEEYRRTRGILFDDFDLWFPGPAVTTVDTLKTEVERLLSDPGYYRHERERFNTVVNGNVTDACSRVTHFLLDILPVDKNVLARLNETVERAKRLDERVRSLEEQCRQTEQQRADGERQLHLVEDERAMLAGELAAIRGSRSWHVAQGMASVARKARRLGGAARR